MDYQAIIFDMDGTIVDTERIWVQANRILVQRRGIEVTPELRAELKRRISGLASHKSCAIIKELVGLKDPLEDLIKEKSEIALNLYNQGISFIEGFEQFHARLMPHTKRAVATNATDATIAITDKKLNLKHFFGKHVYGISCVGDVCKPDPAIYLYAAEQLGVQPGECIALEDSAHGVAAAKAAGMYCIGINSSGDLDQVRQADRIIDTYHDLDIKKLRG